MLQTYFDQGRTHYVECLRQRRSRWRWLMDRAALVWIACVSDDRALRAGLTPLDLERFMAVLPWIQGRLLDVGCGDNLLVEVYGNGVGADIVDWGAVDVLLPGDGTLPFDDASFDTVSLLAALNHMTQRDRVLAECRRVLKPQGRIVITMLNPWVSSVVHRIRHDIDPDQTHRAADVEEVWGFWPGQMNRLLAHAGFTGIQSRSFVFGLNRLYVAQVPSAGAEPLTQSQPTENVSY